MRLNFARKPERCFPRRRSSRCLGRGLSAYCLLISQLALCRQPSPPQIVSKEHLESAGERKTFITESAGCGYSLNESGYHRIGGRRPLMGYSLRSLEVTLQRARVRLRRFLDLLEG